MCQCVFEDSTFICPAFVWRIGLWQMLYFSHDQIHFYRTCQPSTMGGSSEKRWVYEWWEWRVRTPSSMWEGQHRDPQQGCFWFEPVYDSNNQSHMGKLAIRDQQDLLRLLVGVQFPQRNHRYKLPKRFLAYRSVTIGVTWSMRGTRLSTYTHRASPELIRTVSHIVAKHVPKEFTFTSFIINSNFPGFLHTDRANCGPSVMITVSQQAPLVGGQLWYNGSILETHNRVVTFDGNLPHATVPYPFDPDHPRYSIVCYTNKLWQHMDPGGMHNLRRLGIPAIEQRLLLPTPNRKSDRERLLKEARARIKQQIKLGLLPKAMLHRLKQPVCAVPLKDVMMNRLVKRRQREAVAA